MEVIGKIRVLKEEQQVTPTLRKRELVVATEEQYPQYISISFLQDKCDLLNSYKVGENIKVSINLRGREWVSPQGEVKYFNDIQGWRVERIQTEMPNQQVPPPVQAADAFEPATNFNEEEHDDLPF